MVEEMRKYTRVVFLLPVMCALLTGGCRQSRKLPETQEAQEEIIWAELYCDVDWWHPAAWSTENGTITGGITEKTGVALKTTVPLRDADKQLSLMLLEDELPDLITVVDSTRIGQLTSSGKVWELEEFLEKYCPDSHLLREFPEDIKQALIKRDGAWYAYPSHMNSADAREIWEPCDSYYWDLVNYSDNNAIMWNRSLLEQLGLSADELSTEEQVMEAWEKAKESGITVDGEKMIPLLIDGAEYWDPTVKYLQYTFGAEYMDEEGNYRDIILSPESRHALYFLNRAYRNGYLEAEQVNYKNAAVKQKIAAGNVLCFIGNIANTDLDATKWISSGAIRSSEGKRPVLGKSPRGGTGWMQTFISKDCKNPGRVAEFLDYMTGEEGMRDWYFGREGEHYSVGEDGRIVLTEEQAALRANYEKTDVGVWWMFENTCWIRSVLAPPKESSRLAQEDAIKIAFGKDESTVIYNSAPFELYSGLLAGDPGQEEAEEALTRLRRTCINRILLAESDAEFEKEYTAMINALHAQGIAGIDAQKNRVFQKNQQEMGVYPEKIND